MNDLFSLDRGDAPLMISIPHLGTHIPGCAARPVHRYRAERQLTLTGIWTASTDSPARSAQRF